MRFATDGFLDTRDDTFVRTPGLHDEETLDPLPEREALGFLLSHAFSGPRTVARPLSLQNRRTLRRAMWTESVNKRMNLVDRVWREISQPAPNGGPGSSDQPQLLQVVLYGDEWAYPLYLDDGTVRVLPSGGLAVGELKRKRGTPRIDVQSET